ncbi:hypothetical protein HA402_003891 [Bradysia odoriphaga]|nr:hypothetical protein HA402_003891 [Bradysia odoriphaga]
MDVLCTIHTTEKRSGPYLDVTDADVSEPVDIFTGRNAYLEYAVALMLIKIKIFTGRTNAAKFVPTELVDRIRKEAIDDNIVGKAKTFIQQKGCIGTKNTYGKAKKTGARVTINFSNDEINKFLTEAPDSKYLAVKTATVIGTHTVCTFTDIRLIRVNMVNDFGTGIVVRIPQRRTDRTRDDVTISGEYAAIVRKYLRLRLRAPIEVKTTKFFIHYRQGKCWPGAIGRKPIKKMAEEIARYLKLENPENYTTESFRMISPKMVNNGFHTDATERSSSTIPSCTITGSVATSFNVGMSNATNSIDYIRLSSSDAENYGPQYGLSGTNDAIDVDSDDEDSRASSSKSNEKMSDADLSADIFNKSLTATHRTVQSKIDEQAKQIVRLKQVVEDQSLEIKILKDLLADSMRRSIRDEMSRSFEK